MAIAGEQGFTEEDFTKADADHNGESHSSAQEQSQLVSLLCVTHLLLLLYFSLATPS